MFRHDCKEELLKAVANVYEPGVSVLTAMGNLLRDLSKQQQ